MFQDRFFLLDAGASRPTRVPLPPSMSVKAGAADTEGRFTLMENRGDGHIPAHVHDASDELVYVLDGDLGIEFDGATHHLTAGMFALLPRGVAHAMRNLGADGSTVHTLQLSAPGGWERYLEDVCEAGEGDGPMPAGGRRDRRRLNELGEPYGMRYLLGQGDPAESGDKSRFHLLRRGQARPGRIAVPPAFGVKARTEDTDGLISLLEVTVAQPVPRHTHHVAGECIHVVDGVLEIDFDGVTHRPARGGSSCCRTASRTPSAPDPPRRPRWSRSPHPAAGSAWWRPSSSIAPR